MAMVRQVFPSDVTIDDLVQTEQYDLEAIKRECQLRLNDVLSYDITKEVSVIRPAVRGTWLLRSYSEEVIFMNIKGETTRTIKMNLDSPIRNICVSPTTGNLWLCCNVQRTINEVKGGSDAVLPRFAVESLPFCVCITPNEKVLVGTELKVSLYTTSGEKMAETSKDRDGKFHVIQPRNIAVCPGSRNIAICNRDWTAWGGNDDHHVVVMNDELLLKYRLYGAPSTVEGRPSTFDPYDVVYDAYGQLLIADHGNQCVQIISGEGDFLATILTDVLAPKSIGLQQTEFLWLGYENCVVKAVKYGSINDMRRF